MVPLRITASLGIAYRCLYVEGPRIGRTTILRMCEDGNIFKGRLDFFLQCRNNNAEVTSWIL